MCSRSLALDEEESLLEDELEEEAALAAGEGAGPKSVGETQAPRHSTAGQERLKSDLEQEAKVCVCVQTKGSWGWNSERMGFGVNRIEGSGVGECMWCQACVVVVSGSYSNHTRFAQPVLACASQHWGTGVCDSKFAYGAGLSERDT